jgi:hypothetical protein
VKEEMHKMPLQAGGAFYALTASRHVSVPGWCDFGNLVPGEYEVRLLPHEFTKILLKHRFPEGMDFLEPVRVNEDSLHVVSIVPDHAKQLLSGAAVKVAFKP